MMTGKAGGLHADTFFHAFLAQVGTPRPGCDGNMGAERSGSDTQCFRAVEHNRADVAGFQLIGAHHFTLRFHQRFLVEGHFHLEYMGRVEQALGMFLEAEDGGAAGCLVCAHPLEHAHAVVQRVRQHVGSGIAPGHEFAVIPDKAIAVRHRHS